MSFYLDPVLYHGRPADCTARSPREIACYDMLDALDIPYDRADHDEAPTIEACEAVDSLLGTEICKNLFLCNRQKTQFYLLMLSGNKVFKTKELSRQLGCARLSFAQPEDMERCLGLHPGSVSVMGLMNDTEHLVQLVIDKPVAEQVYWGFHPCINTSSLRARSELMLERFLPAVDHTPIFVDLPDPEAE